MFESNPSAENQREGRLHWRKGTPGQKPCGAGGKRMLCALLATAAVMAGFWMIFPPGFIETGDDAIMAGLTYGAWGAGTPRLVRINVLVGYALQLCLRLLPQVPWYTVFQFVLIYLSFTALVYLLLQRFDGCRRVFPLALLFICFGYSFFSAPQYEKTAALAVIAGLLLMGHAVSASRRWYTYGAAGALTLAGSLYRFQALGVLLPLLLGAGVLWLWQPLREKQWRRALRSCVPFGLTLALCIVCYAVDRQSYRGDWEDVPAYNARMERVQANLPEDAALEAYQENRALYASLGITENDYAMYCADACADPALLTQEAAGALSAGGAAVRRFPETVRDEIWDGFFFPTLLLAVAIGVLGGAAGRKRELFLLIYALAAFAGVRLYGLYQGGTLSDGLLRGLELLLVLLLMLYVWTEDMCLPERRRVSLLFAGVALLAAIPGLRGTYETHKNALEYNGAPESHTLIRSDTQRFYLYDAAWSGFPNRLYDVWHVLPPDENCAALGTWRASTPMAQSQLAAYGITNPYSDMVDRPDILVVCESSAGMKRILTHIREHYAPDADAALVKNIDNACLIYRVVEGAPKLDTRQAEDGTELLHYAVDYQAAGETLVITGEAYQDNTNSFAANIYLGIVSDGAETLCCATQTRLEAAGMNGTYGAFTAAVNAPAEGSAVNLYLETEECLYRVPLGEIPAQALAELTPAE